MNDRPDTGCSYWCCNANAVFASFHFLSLYQKQKESVWSVYASEAGTSGDKRDFIQIAQRGQKGHRDSEQLYTDSLHLFIHLLIYSSDALSSLFRTQYGPCWCKYQQNIVKKKNILPFCHARIMARKSLRFLNYVFCQQMFANHEIGCRFPNTLDHVVHEPWLQVKGQQSTLSTCSANIKLSRQFKQKKKKRTFIKK